MHNKLGSFYYPVWSFPTLYNVLDMLDRLGSEKLLTGLFAHAGGYIFNNEIPTSMFHAYMSLQYLPWSLSFLISLHLNFGPANRSISLDQAHTR
ncbi:MAG: hypothetical protein WCA08_14645 [Desulfoferrobacter sp.]